MSKPKSLEALLAKAKAVGQKAEPKSKAAEHPTIELPDTDRAVVGQMIGVSVVFKEVEARLNSLKDQAKSALFHAFTRDFWKQRSKPANPKVFIQNENGEVEHDVLYQMQDRFSLGQFKSRDNIFEALTAGEDEDSSCLTEQQANLLIDEEILTDPVIRMRYNLSELTEGHMEKTPNGSTRFVEATDAEKVMGEKVLAYLTADRDPKGKVTLPGLTDEEKAFLIVWDDRIKFRDVKGFMARVCGYLTNIHQLRRVISTFNPVQMFSHMHFATTSSPFERQARLVEVVRDVLGDPSDVDLD